MARVFESNKNKYNGPMASVLLDTDVLFDLLSKHSVSVYRLAKTAEKRGVSQAMIYALANGRNQPSLDSLGVLVASLREATGEMVQAGDLLKYLPDETLNTSEADKDDKKPRTVSQK